MRVANMKRTNEPYAGGNAPSVAGSETSALAADAIEPQKLTLRDRVHAALCAARDAGEIGLTDDEIEVVTGLKHQTASARRRELVLLSQVVDSGERRKTRSGRLATVWRVVEVNEQLSLTGGPSQVEVVRDKLRARLGKLETLEQLDEVWQLVSAMLEPDAVDVEVRRISEGTTRYADSRGYWEIDKYSNGNCATTDPCGDTLRASLGELRTLARVVLRIPK